MTDTRPEPLWAATPLDRATMQSQVQDGLRQRLLLGELEPGQPLKINALAEAFGVSAQPVREAIQHLVAARALDSVANRSVRVPVLNVDQLEDLRVARNAVEGVATELAAVRATAEQMDRLSAITLQAMRADQNGDVSQSVALNLDFHFTLYRLSGSQELLPMIEALWLRIGPVVRRAAASYDARDGRGVQLHLQAIDCMKKNDALGARRAIEADIDRSFDVLKQQAAE